MTRIGAEENEKKQNKDDAEDEDDQQESSAVVSFKMMPPVASAVKWSQEVQSRIDKPMNKLQTIRLVLL